MARRPKKKIKRYTTEVWGENFGKFMEKRGKEFGEEIGELGKRFGKNFEDEGKKLEKEWKGWWFRTFGLIGPLVGSIFGIVFLAIGIVVLNLINMFLGSSFISLVSNFIFRNLYFFFAVLLFFGYSDYLSKRFPKTFWIAKPMTTSLGIALVIWISIWILSLVNIYVGSRLITSLTNFLYLNMWGVFFVFLVFGYALIAIKKIIMDSVGFK